MTIYAYTEPHKTYPAYVNLTESELDTFALTVRSAGNDGRDVGVIPLSREQLLDLIAKAGKYLGVADAAEKKTSWFGVAGTEQQQLRIRAFEMAMATPGVRSSRDVIGTSAEYYKRILGEVPMGLSTPAPASTADAST